MQKGTEPVTNKFLLFVAGYLYCAKKGLVFMFWDRIDPNGHDVSEDNWGLDDPFLLPEWLLIQGPRPLSHTLTNIVVEYSERSKHGTRTFAKLSAAWTVLGTVLGFALGYLLG